jgi:hypothetical protein
MPFGLLGNPLWNAAGKQVVLDAARGGTTSFQLVVDGPVSEGRLRLTGSRPLLLARQEAWSVKFGVPRPLPLEVRSSALPARLRHCARQRVAADGPWVD